MFYSQIKFKKTEDGYVSNLEADFGCFALWQDGRPYLKEIRKKIEAEFEILLESEIFWTDRNFHANAQRLYETPLFLNQKEDEIRSGHAKKIGRNSFIIFIVKDLLPEYSYAQSVSGKIELTNLRIASVKQDIRALIEKFTEKKYGIHSTNNIYEFFFQVPLLLGTNRFERLLNGERLDESVIKKDLEGADGWNNYAELFKILNYTGNYLVLRSFESLPHSNPELDIDFLTDNFQRLASSMGSKQRESQPYKGTITVRNENISVDIRFIGDGYYDTSWAKDIIFKKTLRNNVYVPGGDDYFFSLLYHCKVQKPEVKEKYYFILDDLAEKLRFDWFNSEILKDNELVARLLFGYMSGQGYYYKRPLDKGVYENPKIVPNLPYLKRDSTNLSLQKRLKVLLKNNLPKKWIRYIVKIKHYAS